VRSALTATTLAALTIAGCGGGSRSSTMASPTPTTTSSTTSTTSTSTASSAEQGGPGGRLAEARARRIPYTAVARSLLTSTKPALVCRRFVTKSFVRTAYGDRAGCVQAQGPGSAADSLRGSGGKRTGPGTAVVSEVATGGPYDGERVKVSLVLVRGAWKVDALHANVPVGP
jgi:hypothetical protein